MRFLSPDESTSPEATTLFELWCRGDWLCRPVAGESFHEHEIRSLLPGTLGEQPIEVQEQALLVPEPTNQHDRHAVTIVIRGHHAGYLIKDDAALYQPVLVRLLGQGLQPVVPATIRASEYPVWTGTDRRGRDTYATRFNVNVTLTLDEPHMCAPVNLPPMSAYALLPFGGAIQVKGEEQHQGALARYVHPAGEQWAYATLAVVEHQSARTSKQVVGVALDGALIGELTPAMSAEFLPVIERLLEVGKTCAARVIVKGNPVKADVVLHSAKAGALNPEWLATNLQPSTSSSAAALEGSVLAGGSAQHPPIPPRPTRIVFQVPDSWPQPPEGWEPPPAWEPPKEWPLAPPGWRFWTVA